MVGSFAKGNYALGSDDILFFCIVLTGGYSMPVELTEAQNAGLGQRLEPDVIAAAADAAYAASRPVDNTGGAIIQRRRTLRVFVRRALEELADDPSAGRNLRP